MFYNENIFFLKLYFCLIRCRSPPPGLSPPPSPASPGPSPPVPHPLARADRPLLAPTTRAAPPPAVLHRALPSPTPQNTP
jgi:hypothetical protein